MDRITLKFKTKSPVILSARTEKALYKGIDYKEHKECKDTKIIYPFYSRCNRELADDKDFIRANTYYIPASSLKGALLCGNSVLDGERNLLRSEVLAKDINVDKEYIRTDNLYKFQYLYQENAGVTKAYKIPKLNKFFPNIKVEMLINGVEFEGEVLLKGISEADFIEIIESTYKITKEKLGNYITEIDRRLDVIGGWKKDIDDAEGINKAIRELTAIKDKIEELKKQNNLIFLGGYKGILGSLSKLSENNRDFKSGFYIDKFRKLPYGLVKVEFKG